LFYFLNNNLPVIIFIYIFHFIIFLFSCQECYQTCPSNYGPAVGDFDVNICSPLSCVSRVPTTDNYCVVFEDVDAAVECLRINETTCSSQCPVNMDPLIVLGRGICTVRACTEREPNIGVCSMPGDSATCYSMAELNRCYTTCPNQSSMNISNSSNPSCTPIPCTSRSPDGRGVCLISSTDECYAYNGNCVNECPGLTSYQSENDKVCYGVFVRSSW
jgi:hypothetical protein